MKVNMPNPLQVQLQNIRPGETFRMGSLHDNVMILAEPSDSKYLKVSSDRMVVVDIANGKIRCPLRTTKVIPVQVEANVIKGSK